MGMERAYITTTGKGKSRPIFPKMRLHLFSFFCMSNILKRLLRLFLFFVVGGEWMSLQFFATAIVDNLW